MMSMIPHFFVTNHYLNNLSSQNKNLNVWKRVRHNKVYNLAICIVIFLLQKIVLHSLLGITSCPEHSTVEDLAKHIKYAVLKLLVFIECSFIGMLPWCSFNYKGLKVCKLQKNAKFDSSSLFGVRTSALFQLQKMPGIPTTLHCILGPCRGGITSFLRCFTDKKTF